MTKLQHETSQAKGGRRPLELVSDVVEKDDGRYLIYFTFRDPADEVGDVEAKQGEDTD